MRDHKVLNAFGRTCGLCHSAKYRTLSLFLSLTHTHCSFTLSHIRSPSLTLTHILSRQGASAHTHIHARTHTLASHHTLVQNVPNYSRSWVGEKDLIFRFTDGRREEKESTQTEVRQKERERERSNSSNRINVACCDHSTLITALLTSDTLRRSQVATS